MRADFLEVSVNAFRFWTSPRWAQVHWHTEEETRARTGGREQHGPTKKRVVKESGPYVSLPWDYLWHSPTCQHGPELSPLFSKLYCTGFFGAVPEFFFRLTCVYLAGVQTRVKEEQIDTPSGRCLALTVCGKNDGFYLEKRPKHRTAEVSKLRKSQKWETTVDLSCLNVLLMWIWMVWELLFYVKPEVQHLFVFQEVYIFSIFWLQFDWLVSAPPFLVVGGCRHADACIHFPN